MARELTIGDHVAFTVPFGEGYEHVTFTVIKIDGDRVEAFHRCGSGWELTACCRLQDVDPSLWGWCHRGSRLLKCDEKTRWKVKIPA